jgi:hypothetical protein
MESGRLERDMISESRLWRLAIGLGDASIDVVLTCSAQDNSLIWRTIPLDKSADSRLRAIEDAIYDNPLLLCDFGWVDVVVDTTDVAVIPGTITSDDCINDIAEATFGKSEDPVETMSSPLHGLDASIVMRMNVAEAGFFRRTYYNVKFHHRLAPLCRHFYGHNSLGRSSGKMFAHLKAGSVDIMAFGAEQLRIANSFRCQGVADAVYFILATRKMLGMTADDELLLSGDPDVRVEATPVLREYIGCVMPVVFPSELMRCGHDAIHAPLELIILPSCE